jgi:hypothetical protein
MTERFDYETYERLLARIRKTHTNLVFADLADGDIAEPFYLLRHDVDLSPEAALAMAVLETNLGVRASYFLFVSSALYNLHSEEYCQLPARLIEMGHEVGLHYDVVVYNRRPDIRKAYESERASLAALAGRPIRVVALHNPSLADGDPLRADPDVVNAYTVIDTHHLTYVSDSCGSWRDESFRVLAQHDLPPRLQILVHPFFWSEKSADRWERLERFVDRRRSATELWARQLREQWSQHEGLRQHEERRKALAESRRRAP